MEQKLQASEKFDVINSTQNPVGQLNLIWSITHKHDNVKGGTMAYVEHNLGLFMSYQ